MEIKKGVIAMTNEKLSSKWSKVGQNPIWDFKKEGKGAKFYGIYISKEENVGPNESNLYKFMRFEDQEMTNRSGICTIWGTTLLDTRFKNLDRGEEVAIFYLGEEESEQRRGSTYHNFEVYHNNPNDFSDPKKDENIEDVELDIKFDELME